MGLFSSCTYNLIDHPLFLGCQRVPRLLCQLGSVREIIPKGSTIITRVDNGTAALPGLITALERAAFNVRSATLSQPSLDDVYLLCCRAS